MATAEWNATIGGHPEKKDGDSGGTNSNAKDTVNVTATADDRNTNEGADSVTDTERATESSNQTFGVTLYSGGTLIKVPWTPTTYTGQAVKHDLNLPMPPTTLTCHELYAIARNAAGIPNGTSFKLSYQYKDQTFRITTQEHLDIFYQLMGYKGFKGVEMFVF